MKGMLKVTPKVKKIGEMLNQKANQGGTTSRRVATTGKGNGSDEKGHG